MLNSNEILGISKCDCGRPYCQFFGGGIGEYGESFKKSDLENTLKEAEQELKELPKAIKHIKDLLTHTTI